jgi:hypothetical protein
LSYCPGRTGPLAWELPPLLKGMSGSQMGPRWRGEPGLGSMGNLMEEGSALP